MTIKLNIEEMKNSLRAGKKFSHKINEKMPILPFTTREPERPKFKEGFKPIVGEFVRNISGLTIEEDTDIETLVTNICNKVKVESEEDKLELKRIIESYLLDENRNINIVNPSWYCLVPLSSTKEQVGEKRTGRFLSQLLRSKQGSIPLNTDSTDNHENVLTKLINSSIKLKQASNKDSQVYNYLLPQVSNVFLEDYLWMQQNPHVMTKHLDKLLHYYFFFYISQLSLKLNQFTSADYTTITPVYYALDWEKYSKRRKGYMYGWQMIKNAGENILVHVNTLEQLNYLDGIDGPVHYVDLASKIKDIHTFKGSIDEWIKYYRSNFYSVISEEQWNSLTLNEEESVEAAIKNLYQTLLFQYNNNDSASVSRYQKWFEETVSLQLSKSRGQLGKMLNMTQDYLMFFTLIALKNEKTAVNDLFMQFERRGIFFDQYSQQEILDLFDRLNLLEKKSDSGDAQYVKPIL